MFGAHLCGLDMRQNSRVHEQVVAELVAAAGVCSDYAALDEAARVGAPRSASSRRPGCSPSRNVGYSDLTTGEIAVLAEAADAIARVGRLAIPHYVISMAGSVSDVLEVAILLKEVGLVRRSAAGALESDLDIVPLFETIADLSDSARTLTAMLANPTYRSIVDVAVPGAGGDGRLLRLQQGRGLSHVALEPLRRPGRTRRCRRARVA